MSRKVLLRSLTAGAGVAAAIFTARLAGVHADGIPSASPLAYGGYLEQNGVPVDTAGLDFVVRVWTDASSEASADQACQTVRSNVPVRAGRFRVELDETCVDAIKDHADTWIEVAVGATSLGRTKVTATPYALEAARASSATGELASQTVPAGAVMFFNLARCPNGWTELADAQGRYLVGAAEGAAVGTSVGQALSDGEDRSTGRHSHVESAATTGLSVDSKVTGLTITNRTTAISVGRNATGVSLMDPGHTHGIGLGDQSGGGSWYWSNALAFSAGNTVPIVQRATTSIAVVDPTHAHPLTDPGHNHPVSDPGHTHAVTDPRHTHTIGEAGNVAGTNAPYLQLRVCQKG